ncbi:helix-turn-helix domain-containing protein [Nocardia vinacea]|uniref:helix-turn-helix domain-containing protein n=1 Tax=Nocardia vinacea TaxID=96468 RepID=UPI00030611FA|nr:helix-turn-helix domain-containing protein [Nocardia vinacea]
MSGEVVWLSTDDVAERLKIPKKTLAAWASAGRGPRYARMGRYRRYRLSDLLAWEQEQLDKT